MDALEWEYLHMLKALPGCHFIKILPLKQQTLVYWPTRMARKPCKECNRFQRLPYEIQVLILSLLRPESQVCLALTCHTLHDMVVFTLDEPLRNICRRTWKCLCNGQGWVSFDHYHHHPHPDFFGLMSLLRGWMPTDYTFCYLCHKYRSHNKCPLTSQVGFKAISHPTHPRNIDEMPKTLPADQLLAGKWLEKHRPSQESAS
jgi:hypothetical protein